MATNAIVNVNNIDVSKITFSEIRVNKAGGKSVQIKYNGQSLQIRVPKMSYPAGLNVRIDENNGSRTYTIPASLTGCDSYAKERDVSGSEVGNLYNFLLDLQEKIVKTAVDRSVSWFSKARKEEVLRDSFKQILSPSVEKVNGEWIPNGKYPPSFRMKVPVYDGQVSMEAVDSTGQPIELNESNLEQRFPKRVQARLVAAPSIYVTGSGFGVTWRITYAQIFPTQRVTAAQVFSDFEEEEETTTPAVAAQSEETPREETEEQVQEDEDEEETPAPAPVPAPVPAAAPKNRRRVVAA
jgi:hypothetical protein